MESGEFSRGKESIRADGGMVMVGNFDVDVEHQLREQASRLKRSKKEVDDALYRLNAGVPLKH